MTCMTIASRDREYTTSSTVTNRFLLLKRVPTSFIVHQYQPANREADDSKLMIAVGCRHCQKECPIWLDLVGPETKVGHTGATTLTTVPYRHGDHLCIDQIQIMAGMDCAAPPDAIWVKTEPLDLTRFRRECIPLFKLQVEKPSRVMLRYSSIFHPLSISPSQ
jgi:hypothetical protein